MKQAKRYIAGFLVLIMVLGLIHTNAIDEPISESIETIEEVSEIEESISLENEEQTEVGEEVEQESEEEEETVLEENFEETEELNLEEITEETDSNKEVILEEETDSENAEEFVSSEEKEEEELEDINNEVISTEIKKEGESEQSEISSISENSEENVEENIINDLEENTNINENEVQINLLSDKHWYECTDGVTRSAFEYAYNLGQADTCIGVVKLNGKQETDSGIPNVWPTGNWAGNVDITGYNWVHAISSNPSVATVSYRTEEGKLFITFTPGKKNGITKVSVGVDALFPHYSLGTWNMELNFDYTVTNTVNEDTTPPIPPEKPTVNDLPSSSDQNGYVDVKCVTYPNSNPHNSASRKHSGYVSLKNSTAGWSFGEVYANDGRFGNDAPQKDYPYLCDLILDKDWYLNLYNKSFASQDGTHYLNEPNETVSVTFLYGTNENEWLHFTEDFPLTVWTTHQKQIINADYRVEWYDASNNKLLKSEIRNDAIGNTVSATETDKIIEGYTFDEANKNNILSEALTTGTVLKLYFTLDKPKINELRITKTPSKEYLEVKEEFQYIIKVDNPTSYDVNVKITDTLDEKLDFVKVSDGGSYNEEIRTVTWENVKVPANGSKELHLWVKANDVGEIENRAVLYYDNKTISAYTIIIVRKPHLTVTYTDGVNNTVFWDESYSALEERSPTPTFTKNLNRKGYKFVGWKLISVDSNKTGIQPTVEVEDANSDRTIIYEAQWEEIKYIIGWYDEDKLTHLDKNTFLEDEEEPSYSKELPTKEEDEKYTYIFKEWVLQETPLNEDDISYVASYTPIPKKYTYTIEHQYYTDGELDETEIVLDSAELDEIIDSSDFEIVENYKDNIYKFSTVTPSELKITVLEEDNKIIFRYDRFSYKVIHQYLNENGDLDGQIEEVFYSIKDEEIKSDSIEHKTLYNDETYPYVSDSGNLVISDNVTDNIITIIYQKEKQLPKETTYTVKWFDTENHLLKEEIRTGFVEEIKIPNESDYIIDGYTFLPKYKDNILSIVLKEDFDENVLILYFTRNIEEEKLGSYIVKHQYYVKDKDGKLTLENVVSEKEIVLKDGAIVNVKELNHITINNSKEYKFFEDSGNITIKANEISEIIMKYVRDEEYGSYNVKHEYYIKDNNGNLTLEGSYKEDTISFIKLGTIVGVSDADIVIQKRYNYSNNTYEFLNSSNIVIEVNSNKELIIKYYRNESKEIINKEDNSSKEEIKTETVVVENEETVTDTNEVKTGDNSHIFVYGFLFIFSIMGICFLKKKK